MICLVLREDVAYAERPIALGIRVTLDDVMKGSHGFERFGASTEEASACLRRSREWLGQAVGARHPRK